MSGIIVLSWPFEAHVIVWHVTIVSGMDPMNLGPFHSSGFGIPLQTDRAGLPRHAASLARP